jgi:high-affinity nickel-transport protein
MITFLSIIAVGFFLGMRHATDPDHVIAVTTIVSRQNKLSRAALTGIVWGVGHTLTIFVVGTAIILFGVVIPTRVGLSMEFSVAVMLVILGGMNVSAFIRSVRSIAAPKQASAGVHTHPHSHGDYVHSHSHGHTPESHFHAPGTTPVARMDRFFGSIAAYRHFRPLLVGIVHGLAGSAAVALLILASIREPRWAVAYLLVFGLGTVAGMMLITISIASAFSFFGRRYTNFSARLGLASGVLSLAFGMLLVYQIGIVGGLFAAHPHWSPR